MDGAKQTGLARPEELDAVVALYDAVHTAQEEGVNWQAWKRGWYPARQHAQCALAQGTLYVLREEETGQIVATAILNQEQASTYAMVPWGIEASPDKVAVLHTFMVHPAHARKGYASRMLMALHAEARSKGCVCLRLDTHERNMPAQTFYTKLGYQDRGTITLEESPGNVFRAYELEL